MWQVAKQCDGRGEDDTTTAVPIPRFLAQPPAASPWHDSLHGMSSTSSTALLSSNDCEYPAKPFVFSAACFSFLFLFLCKPLRAPAGYVTPWNHLDFQTSSP